MPTVYNIYSDLNSQDVHEALLDTFRKWIQLQLRRWKAFRKNAKSTIR